MRILIANDHGAIELKSSLVNILQEKGHIVENIGVDTSESVDYPDIARKAVQRYLAGGFDFGILCCGSGIGISIAANKFPGIRCAQIFDLYTAEMCKKHNNANFIAFGGRNTYSVPIIDMIEKYMLAEFEGGRHALRVKKIDDLI